MDMIVLASIVAFTVDKKKALKLDTGSSQENVALLFMFHFCIWVAESKFLNGKSILIRVEIIHM